MLHIASFPPPTKLLALCVHFVRSMVPNEHLQLFYTVRPLSQLAQYCPPWMVDSPVVPPHLPEDGKDWTGVLLGAQSCSTHHHLLHPHNMRSTFRTRRCDMPPSKVFTGREILPQMQHCSQISILFFPENMNSSQKKIKRKQRQKLLEDTNRVWAQPAFLVTLMPGDRSRFWLHSPVSQIAADLLCSIKFYGSYSDWGSPIAPSA